MTTTYEPNVVLVKEEFDVVGTRPIRHDGADKVTGRARYASDFKTASTLAGMILRSPHAHAKVLSIDTTKAEALPGVRAVVTGHDFPDSPPGEEWSGTLGTFKIKDAIKQAVGVRLQNLPMNPGAVTAALQAKNGG